MIKFFMKKDQKPKFALILCPGGLANQGGIGKMVSYFTREWEGMHSSPSYEVVDTRGIGSLRNAPIVYTKALLTICSKLFRRQVYLLHIHMASYGSTVRKLLIVFLAKCFKVPVILHLHGAEFHIFYRNLPQSLKYIIRKFFQSVDKVIVLGSFWKEFICNELDVESQRVVQMPNAVLIPTEKSKESGSSRVKLLFLGRIGKRKGVPEILRALASNKVRHLAWEAVLAGDGDVEKYREEAESLSLAEQVNFLGWSNADTIDRLLGESDILLLPSYNEGLPMAMLEGMAHGLAVITTPVGAIPEVIEHNKNGLLITPGDEVALAQALESLITDISLRSVISQNARESIVERFGINAYATRMNVLYAECATTLQSS